jgi:EmrB/QacA subfamily drug resistance transporter
MLSIFMAALDQTIISLALTRISGELGQVGLLAWTVSGYLVAVAVATPIYGKLGDLFGRRITLLSAIGIFALASVACACATTMPALIAGRIVQGIGGGGLFSIAQAIIADVVAPRERSRYQAYVSGTFALASVAGPALGGVLLHYASWRSVFWINVPLALVAIVIAHRALALLPVPRIRRPVDYPGALLLSAGLVALMSGTTRVGQGSAWLDTINAGLFLAAFALLALFLRQQGRAREPLLPMSLFAIPTVRLCCAILLIAFFQIVSLSVMIPLQLQMATGLGTGSAALQLIPLTLAVPFGAFLGGRIMNRSGKFKPCLLWGSATVTVALALLALTDPHIKVIAMLLMIIAGIGIGVQFPTGLVAVQNAVPREHIGIATAMAAFSRSLGAAIGVAILSAVLLASLRSDLPSVASMLPEANILQDLVDSASAQTAMQADAVRTAFRRIFLLSAAASFVAMLLASALRDPGTRSH